MFIVVIALALGRGIDVFSRNVRKLCNERAREMAVAGVLYSAKVASGNVEQGQITCRSRVA